MRDTRKPSAFAGEFSGRLKPKKALTSFRSRGPGLGFVKRALRVESRNVQELRPGAVRLVGDEAKCDSLKEVIHPHLPVRVPCYDLVPLTPLTFDRSLPCGLGHGLRVKTIQVT